MTQSRTLAERQPYPSAIAVDGEHVYWVSAVQGAVLRAPRRGGAATAIAEDLGVPLSLCLDEVAVFVTVCEEDGAIVRIPKRGGEPEAIAPGQVFPACLAVDGEGIYWTTLGDDRDNGQVCSAEKSGDGFRILAEGQLGPDGIGVDEAYVYWLTRTDCVWRAPKGGGEAVALHRPHEVVEERLLLGEEMGVSSSIPRSGMMLSRSVVRPPAVRRIVIDEEKVYWQNAAGAITVVGRWDEDRDESPLLLAIDRSAPGDVALDEESVYWVDHDEGRVMRVARVGGRPRVFADGQTGVVSIAVDDEAVYWGVTGAAPSYADGAVRTKRKASIGRARRR
jgi:hypothetical protein